MRASNHPYFEGDYPLVLPHRGGMEVVPENTLEAVVYANENKFTHFETDLRMSKDGIVFLHHDETLDRTTDSKGKVAEYNWRDLLKINAGKKFYDKKKIYNQETQFISLEDALIKFPDIKYNLDLKQPGMAELVLTIIMDCKATERTLVSSFSPYRLRQFQLLNNHNIATSGSIKENLQALIHSNSFNLWKPDVDALQIPIKWKGIPVLSKNLVDYAHNKNLLVHIWTVNDASTLRDCVSLGCDGYITDRPIELRSLLEDLYG